jgi:hypothetical protein
LYVQLNLILIDKDQLGFRDEMLSFVWQLQ